jgi:hypothetical protein
MDEMEQETGEKLTTDFSVSLAGGPTTQGNRMRPMKVFEI